MLLYPADVLRNPGINSRPMLRSTSGPKRDDTLDVPLGRIISSSVHQRSSTIPAARVPVPFPSGAKLGRPQLHLSRPEGCPALGLLDYRQTHLELDRTVSSELGPSPSRHPEGVADRGPFRGGGETDCSYKICKTKLIKLPASATEKVERNFLPVNCTVLASRTKAMSCSLLLSLSL